VATDKMIKNKTKHALLTKRGVNISIC